MDVDCRWPGSCHDTKVYANSSITRNMQQKKIHIISKEIIPGKGKIPIYLVGDPAYPLTSFCIKEHESCKSNAQTGFNSMLREARNPIECAYGRLKARWGILNKTIDFKLESIPEIILTCFALHNFCERNKQSIDEDLLESQQMFQRNGQTCQEHHPDKINSGNTMEGIHVRTLLPEYIG